MSWSIRLTRPAGIDTFQVMNTLVQTVPGISFHNIEPSCLLMGLKDLSLRGVVLNEEDEAWEILLQTHVCEGDMLLFESVVRILANTFGCNVLVPEESSPADSMFGTGFEDDGFGPDDDTDDIFGGSDDGDYDDGEGDDDEEEDDPFGDSDPFGEDDDEDDDDDDEEEDGDDDAWEIPYREVPFSEVENDYFSHDWKRQYTALDMGMLRAMVSFSGDAEITQGIFMTFCIGPQLLGKFGIGIEPPAVPLNPGTLHIDSTPLDEMPEGMRIQIKRMMDFATSGYKPELELESEIDGAMRLLSYLGSVQWKFRDIDDTSTEMRAVDPELLPELAERALDPDRSFNPEEVSRSVSDIRPARLESGRPLLISYAQVAAFTETDSERSVLVPFEKVSRFISGQRIDELQVYIETPLGADSVRSIMQSALAFTPREVFSPVNYPGQPFAEGQQSFVLMWNPDISSFKIEDMRRWISEMRTYDMNWSIHEYQEARMGDRFYLICCGGEHRGLVATGIFCSNPYQDEDWSGRGRRTYYMDLRANVLIDPEYGGPVSLAELDFEIPDFQWDGGHSGRRLTFEQARHLADFWEERLPAYRRKTDGLRVNTVNPQTY